MADENLPPITDEGQAPEGPKVPEWASGIEDPDLLKQLEAAGFATPADAVKAWSSSRKEMDRIRTEKDATEAEFLAFMESLEEQQTVQQSQQQPAQAGEFDWAAYINSIADPTTGEVNMALLAQGTDYASLQRDAAIANEVEALKAEIEALKSHTEGQLAPVVSAYTSQAMNAVFSDMRDVYGGEFESLRGDVQNAITARASKDSSWIPTLDDVREEFQKAAGRKYEDELRSRSRVTAARSLDAGSASNATRGGTRQLTPQEQMIADLESQLSPGGL